MKKNLLKCLSLVLCMAMCLGMCGTTAFATQGGADEPQVVQELGTDEELSIETVETDKTAQINEGETLYERLMAAETAAEMADILDEQEEAPSFTEDELSALIAKANAFEESDDKTALLANLEYLATGKNETDKIDSTTTEPDDKTALIDATYDSSTRTITMTVGDTYTLTPGITYTEQSFWGGSNTKTASGNFTSNDESVATVEGISNNQYGSSYGRNSYTSATVTAVAAGKTTITFSYTTGGGPNAQTQTATYTVIVNAATGISISGADSVTVGDTIVLTASANKTEDTISSIEWSSSNSAIATVDANGNVKGVANGEVTITATAKMSDGTTYTATKTITVNPKAQEDGTTRVYLYVKVDSTSSNITINGQSFVQNANGWYTIGYIDVPTSVLALATTQTLYSTKAVSTISDYVSYSNVTWYTTNQNLSQAIWNRLKWYELKVDDGAADYVNSGTNAWHLDATATVNKSILTLYAKSGTYTYDGQSHSATGVVTNTFTVNNDTYTVSGYTTSDPTETNAGTYANTISGTYKVTNSAGTDVTNQFDVTYVDGSLVINKAAVTITGESDTKEYTGSEQTITGTSASGLVSGHTYTASYSASGTNPGTYNGEFSGSVTIKDASGNDVTSNYTVTTTPGTLTITKSSAAITVTIKGNTSTVTYNGSAQSVKGYTTDVGDKPITVALASGSSATASGTDAGTYKMNLTTADFTVTSDYYSSITVVVTDGSLTINKRSVTLASATKSKTYDGTALTDNTITVGGDGFVSGEGATYDVTGSQTDVGSSTNTFTYTLKDGTKADNYTITKKEGILTVTDGDDTDPVEPDNVVTKTHDNKAYKLGETVTFTITVKNIYDAEKKATITEQQGVTIVAGDGYIVNADGTATATMNAGASITVKATYTVTKNDIEAGKFTNKVTVSFSGGKTFENTDKVEVDPETPVVIPDTPTPSSGGSSSTTINDEDVPLVSVVDTEDIDDEDVPLVGTVDGVDIDDDDVPLANVPKTSDEIMDWCLVAAIACMVAAGAVVVRRKKRG